MPTLLMTLFSLFCMSRRRLYQLSDSEVTSPAKGKNREEGSGVTPGRPGSSQQAGTGRRAGTRTELRRIPEHFPLLEATQREKEVPEGSTAPSVT